MAKDKKEEALPTGAATAAAPTLDLDSIGYAFFRDAKTGNYSTVKISFDSGLTTAKFSDVEPAGGDKHSAIERLKILLGTKVF